MPLLLDGEVVGLVDAKLDRNGGKPTWQIAGLDLLKPVPPDILRQGLHRLAAIAGAGQVNVIARAPRAIKTAVNGPVKRS
jgi:uncharacterized protein YcaQ